jgi:hypothetical protein
MFDNPLRVAIIGILLFVVLFIIYTLITYFILKFASESKLLKKR